ncbi:MAG: hypothetical protein AAGG48_14880 [Planctomycetota bacterium]
MDEPLFDASSDPNPTPGRETPVVNPSTSRPFIGINFDCCRTYGRIYRNKQNTAYEGRCPSCNARVSVPIGEGGSSSRFFTAN